MGKASRNRTLSARQRIAAQQTAARRADQRRRALLAGSAVVVVIAAVVVIVAAKASQAPPRTPGPVTSIGLARRATTVPAETFDAIGAGTAEGLRPVSGEAELRSGVKPEVLYIGGEFCPYCAAERWAIAAAVSRFGTLSGLRFIHSSPTDGDIATLSFYKSRFTSKYISFDPVEWYGEAADPDTPFGHVYLQQPTRQEAALFARYAGNAIPFLDIGNRYSLPAVSYPPAALTGLTWAQITADMFNTASPVARDIDGAANIITAAICNLTGGGPGSVCHSTGVTAARHSL
jgi:Domain of unknown function (DUF929)